MTKDEIRESIRKLRRDQTSEDRNKKSLMISNNLFSLPELSEYRVGGMNIALFKSFDGEPDMDRISNRLKSMGAQCYFPAISNGSLIMSKAETADSPDGRFVQGNLGIMEPADISTDKIRMDIIIMPGIAFSENGDRIGFGKGYYDKYLSSYHAENMPLLIAPVFEFQITGGFNADPHDIPVDIIVSERRIIYTI